MQSCNYHIHALRQIQNNMAMDIAKTVVNSIVGSRLDYCNELLMKSRVKIYRNCSIQNLAHIVMGAQRLTPLEPMLVHLHWLPIAYCIEYKLSVLTYKSLRKRITTVSGKYATSYCSCETNVFCTKGAVHCASSDN